MDASPIPVARPLGFWRSTAFVIGNMIGSGIFLLPAALAAFGGVSVLGWIVSAAGALCVALTFARLSRILPRAGGHYAYTRAGFGDAAGFVVGWGYWISLMTGNAAIAVAFVSYLGVFIPYLNESAVASGGASIGAIWIVTWVNHRGVREAGSFQLVTAALKIIPLVVLGSIGFLYFDPANLSPFNVSDRSTFVAVSATATLTLWAFLGLESATIAAGEVEDAARTMSRATIAGTLVTSVLYIASTVAVMGIVPITELKASGAPFADAAGKAWGPWATYFVAAGATVSCLGALNGWVFLTGQYPRAIAEDGLFPPLFARVSRRETPTAGLVVAAALVTILVAAKHTKGLVDLFTFAILLSTVMSLVPYTMSALAWFVIRARSGESLPLSDVLVTFAAFAFSIWAIVGAGVESILWGGVLLAAGTPAYWWLRWRPSYGDDGRR